MEDYAKDFHIGFLDACNCHETHNSSKYTYIYKDMDKMMNAPVNVEQERTPISIPKSKTELDRKRYLWAISPALPAIGIGILAGYQFAPRPLKKSLH